MAASSDSDRRIGHYQIGEALGKGAFGTVYKGLNIETGETVAIKRVELTGIPQTELNNLEQELTLLQKLNHPNIVQYVGAVRSEKHLNIMLEFIENGSLLTILKKFGKFPETLAAVYTAQILEGLAYLHGEGVIHRDIKAANTLTTKDGEVKLADFGVATLSKAQRASGNLMDSGALGSPYWMAPEIITMEGSKPASDIWSLGCTIIELMTGEPPFYAMPPMSAMYHIAESETLPPFPEKISPELVKFLTVCFERDPEKRPSAEQLLQHDDHGFKGAQEHQLRQDEQEHDAQESTQRERVGGSIPRGTRFAQERRATLDFAHHFLWRARTCRRPGRTHQARRRSRGTAPTGHHRGPQQPTFGIRREKARQKD